MQRKSALTAAFAVSVMLSGVCACQIGYAQAQADAPAKADDKPKMDADVAAFYKQVNTAYQNLKSYQHTAVYTRQATTPQGEQKQVQKFTLALERPNKLIFKSDKAGIAAVASDGKTLINFRQSEATSEYTKATAPATYKGINLVEDVLFEPQGTYLIALALQGDMLADKDLDAVLALAKMGDKKQENGKTFQTVVISNPNATMTIYADAVTHRLVKIIQKALKVDSSVTEEIQDVQLNKPIDAAVFKYAPPEGAKLVTKLTPLSPQ